MNKLSLLILACAATAFSSESYVLIKTSSTGYTLPSQIRNESCKLEAVDGADMYRLIVSETYGSLRTKKSVELEVTNLIESVEKAKSERVVKSPNYLCDAPATSYYVKNGNEETTLFFTGGCGSPKIERKGVATSNIKALLDKYCPTTYDYERPQGPPR